MDRAEIVWGGVDWISVTQDRQEWRVLLKAVISFRVP